MLFNIKQTIFEKVGVAVVLFLLGGVFWMLVSMADGSNDGRDAKQDNDFFHPFIEKKVDSLENCQRYTVEQMELYRQESNMTDAEIMRTLDRIDKRVEMIYINALEN